MKLWTTSFFLLALLALPVLAGDGKECTDCKDCEECAECSDCCAKGTLSARIADLEAAAANGCEKSTKALATLCEACGARDTAALKATVADCEKACAGGCEKSGATLAKLEKAMGNEPKRLALSAYVAKLSVGCEKGCEISKKQLADLSAACGTGCKETMGAKIKQLEIAAFLGSSKSATEIAALDKALGREPLALPALSVRVTNLATYQEHGCPLSGPILAKLTEGRESTKVLASDLVTLEGKAANGCGKCKGELATLETKLDTVIAAAMAQYASEHPEVLGGGEKSCPEGECPKEKGACPAGGAQ